MNASCVDLKAMLSSTPREDTPMTLLELREEFDTAGAEIASGDLSDAGDWFPVESQAPVIFQLSLFFSFCFSFTSSLRGFLGVFASL